MEKLKPGKTNKEERMNFVTYWADYVRTHTDEDWSKQQKVLIDGQIAHAKQNPLTRKQYLEIKAASKQKHTLS